VGFVCFAVFCTLSVSTLADESELKAAFVTKLIDFVYWPSNQKPEPLVVCLNGDVSRLQPIKAALEQQNIRNVDIQLKPTHLSSCNVIYFAVKNPDQISQLLESADENKAVLTFSAGEGLAERGVMINLIYRDNKMGFEINRLAMRKRGLDVSSRVLKLARIVDE
jgi:hypothetical protein